MKAQGLLEPPERRSPFQGAQFEWYRGYAIYSSQRFYLIFEASFLFASKRNRQEESSMKPITNSLDLKLQEMAGRIRELREIEGLTQE